MGNRELGLIFLACFAIGALLYFSRPVPDYAQMVEQAEEAKVKHVVLTCPSKDTPVQVTLRYESTTKHTTVNTPGMTTCYVTGTVFSGEFKGDGIFEGTAQPPYTKAIALLEILILHEKNPPRA